MIPQLVFFFYYYPFNYYPKQFKSQVRQGSKGTADASVLDSTLRSAGTLITQHDAGYCIANYAPKITLTAISINLSNGAGNQKPLTKIAMSSSTITTAPALLGSPRVMASPSGLVMPSVVP